MSLQAAFQECLVEGDFRRMRRLSAEMAPHLPQPRTDTEAEIALHMARTQAESMSLRARAYSHQWLGERCLPSQLPDLLKPTAERMVPQVVEAVGIAVKATNPRRVEEARAVQKAMSDVVEEMFADGDRDPVLVSQRMAEARERVYRGA